MLRRNIVGLLVCIAALGVATLGFAGIPDVNNSTATTAAAVQVSVFNVPDGSGKAMTEARDAGGNVVDATITVTLYDAGMNPVYLFPFEDIWLQTTLGGLVACPGGALADASTDINGVTHFTGPFNAGGITDPASELCQVVVNGTPLVGSDMDIQFNSPDMNGDGVVNVNDLGIFTSFYPATYGYDADFSYDGVLNLSDLVLFSAAYNQSCP